MRATLFLQAAYLANIVILIPVVWSMLIGRGPASVFDGRALSSPPLELLVGSLWAAILLASVAGLAWPRFFAPVLLIQIVYKALWLALFILPLWRAGETAAIPSGITTVFVFIVLIWPFLFWAGTR